MHTTESWVYWMVAGALILVIWVIVIGIRAIIGEIFKRWFFSDKTIKKTNSKRSLETRAKQLNALESRLKTERMILEGNVMKRWTDQDKIIANIRSAKNNDAA